MYVLPVVPAPSSGAPHDTHAAAGHVQEHPDTRTDTQYKLRLNNVIERLTLSFLFFFFFAIFRSYSKHTYLHKIMLSSNTDKIIVYQNDMALMIKQKKEMSLTMSFEDKFYTTCCCSLIPV